MNSISYRRAVTALMIAVFAAGCQTGQDNMETLESAKQEADQTVSDLGTKEAEGEDAQTRIQEQSSAVRQITGNQIDAYTPPPVGARFRFLDQRPRRTTRNWAEVTSHAEQFNGKNVWVTKFENEGKSYRDFSYNRVGFVNKDGEITSIINNREYFRWPLKPGDSWTTNFTGKNPKLSRSSISQATVSVIGWETIRLPSGTFKTMKVRHVGKSSYNRATFDRTVWFSPELGIVVKGTFEVSSGSSNRKWRGKWHLLEYTLPDN